MSKKKKLVIAIVVLSIIIVLLIITIVIFNVKGNEVEENNESNQNIVEKDTNLDILTTDTSCQLLKSEDMFFTIQNNIENYLSYIVQGNSTAVYSLLNVKYVENNNITKQNVLNKIGNINQFEKFWLEKVYYKEIEFDKETEYYIKGAILTKNYKNKEEVFLVVNYDFENGTYSITPYNNINLKEKSFEDIINHLIKQDDGGTKAAYETKGNGINILKNDYNDFFIVNISGETKMKKHIERYKINALYYIDDAYNTIEQECKEKKFNTLKEYEEYVKETIDRLEAYRYKIDEYDDYIEYTNINKYNEKIIFKESSPMQYTVVLE